MPSRDPFEPPSDHSDQEEGDDSDSEDEVVKRIPVYYTPNYISSLTLLQYPDRLPRPETSHPLLPPSLRPPPGLSNETELAKSKIHAKYKPHSQHLQFQVPVDVAPETWNDEQSSKFSKGLVDEKREKEEWMKKKGKRRKNNEEDDEEERRREQEKTNRRLDKIVYTSQNVPDVTNYLVGVIKDDKLHLSPVTQTYQMRPSLLYLDQLATNERRAKREALAAEEDSDADTDVSDTELKKEAQAKAVHVSVKVNVEGAGGNKSGGGTGAGNGRAGASLFDPLRQTEGEAWIELEHYHAETMQATLAFDKMFAQDENLGVQLTSTTKPSEYLNP